MIYIILALGAVIVVLGLILYAVWKDSLTVTGGPTSEEAKIDAAANLTAGQIVEKSKAEAKEIENADRKTLFALAAKRLRRK